MIIKKYPIVFLGVVLLAVISAVIWYSKENYANFAEYHKRLAERSVHGTSREIIRFINEQNRYVSLFAEREKTLLSELVHDPDDMELHKKLEEKIDIYFPRRFAFSVASPQGNPLLSRGHGLIGKTCRDDIRKFSSGNKNYHIYVHQSPKTERKHYDVMTTIGNQGRKSVFFVSFFLDDIFRLLENGNIEGHHLLLIKRGKHTTLEASTNNAIALYELYGHEFVQIPSVKPNEYRQLLPASMDKIAMASVSIDGTQWELMDVPEPLLLNQYKIWLVLQALGIVALASLVTAVGFFLTKRVSMLSFDTYSVLTNIEKERQRVAMDLHDQVLGDINHISRDCRRLCGSQITPQSMEAHSENIQNQLEQVGNTIRDIIEDLHPQSIGILGLAETIHSYCDKQSHAMPGLAINLSIGEWDEQRLSNMKQLNLFRIIQEVVHNTIRHAKANRCEIDLKMTANKLTLVVEDDGMGVATNKDGSPSGRGIKNIVARGRMIQAITNWSAGSRGTGTRFTLEMPLPAEGA